MTIVNILGESAVRSLVLALAVATSLRLLRIQNVRIAKRAWTAVLLLALAMPPLVAWHIPSFSVTALWAAPPSPTLSAPPTLSASSLSKARPDTQTTDARIAPVVPYAPSQPIGVAPSVSLAVPVPAALQGSPAPARPISWSRSWSYFGFAAYLLLSGLMCLRVLAGLLLSVRLWRRAQAFATSETDLPVRLTVELRSPVTLANGILLPLEAIAWDSATLRATLAHEEAHVREGDFYLQLAASLHLCFFWISPLAWWLRPQLARLSETICDRAAVESTGDGLSYAQLLLRFATAQQTPAGMVAMAQSAGLRERVERLIADPQLASAFRQRRGQALGAALLLGASAVAAAATVHILRPEAVVLAAPQAPAPPPAQPDAAPQAAPQPEPAVHASSPQASAAAPEPLPAPSAPEPAPSLRPSSNAVLPPPPSSGDVSTADAVVIPMAPVGPIVHVRPEIIAGAPIKVLAMPPIEIVSAEDSHRQSFAIYGPGGGSRSHFVSGDWFHDELHFAEEAKKHPGGAILFRRDGKTWVIDNPALVKQAQEAYAPVEALGKQQGELGERQGALGEQQGKLGALQGELGAKQGEWSASRLDTPSGFDFKMPDGFDAAVNQLTANSMKLAMQRNEMSEAQRAALEAQQKEVEIKLDHLMKDFEAHDAQREAFAKQFDERINKQMEPLLKQMQELGAKQGELGRLQGELGRQQGLLGMQQGEASREADRKMQSLIDQALRDGSAHPVQ